MVTRETSNGTTGITDVYLGNYMASAGNSNSSSLLQYRGLTMSTEFKVGDIIEPVVKDGISPNWRGMEILKYEPITRNATVCTKTGYVIEDFNLDPDYGVEFRVVQS